MRETDDWDDRKSRTQPGAYRILSGGAKCSKHDLSDISYYTGYCGNCGYRLFTKQVSVRYSWGSSRHHQFPSQCPNPECGVPLEGWDIV
jgi:DNA-directed RNA polymerase subunit RPC12/RpoP